MKESQEEGDVKGAKKEDESVMLEVPASTDLAYEPNKLVKPEANVVDEDVDEHDTAELEGVQSSFLKVHRPPPPS